MPGEHGTPADRLGPIDGLLRRVERGDAAQLGHAVGLAKKNALVQPGPDDRDRRPGTGDGRQLQGGQVGGGETGLLGHLLEQHRHARHDLDLLVLQSAERAGGLEAALVEDRQAPGQRVQDVPQQAGRAGHGQDVDHPCPGAQRGLGEGKVGDQVERGPVGEQHTLGPGAGPAGVHDLGDVVRARLRARHWRVLLIPQAGERVQVPQRDRVTGGRRASQRRGHPVPVSLVGEHHPGSGVVHQVAQLVRGEPVVEGHHDRAQLERGERGDDPFQAVVANDADPVAGPQPALGVEVRGGVGPAVEVLVANAVRAVEDDGRTAWCLPGPVAKSVSDEFRHGTASPR